MWTSTLGAHFAVTCMRQKFCYWISDLNLRLGKICMSLVRLKVLILKFIKKLYFREYWSRQVWLSNILKHVREYMTGSFDSVINLNRLSTAKMSLPNIIWWTVLSKSFLMNTTCKLLKRYWVLAFSFRLAMQTIFLSSQSSQLLVIFMEHIKPYV